MGQRRWTKVWAVGTMVLLVGGVAWAQVPGDSWSAGFYPALGTARTLGLAGAFTAIADDAGGVLWNPAGIMQMRAKLGNASAAVNVADADYLFLGFVQPALEEGVCSGFAFINASTQAVRDDRVYQYTLAQELVERPLAFGASLKYHTLSTPGAEDEAVSFDLGVLYRYNDVLRLGAAVLDVNEPSFRGIGRQWRMVNLGVALAPDNSTLLAVDYYDVGDHANQAALRFGGERWITERLQLRAGITEGRFSVGFSIEYPTFRVDFAYQRVEEGADLNMLSVQAVFR